jgi:hypothetical protein
VGRRIGREVGGEKEKVRRERKWEEGKGDKEKRKKIKGQIPVLSKLPMPFLYNTTLEVLMSLITC